MVEDNAYLGILGLDNLGSATLADKHPALVAKRRILFTAAVAAFNFSGLVALDLPLDICIEIRVRHIARHENRNDIRHLACDILGDKPRDIVLLEGCARGARNTSTRKDANVDINIWLPAGRIALVLEIKKILERDKPSRIAYAKYNFLTVEMLAVVNFTDIAIEIIIGAKATIHPRGDAISANAKPVFALINATRPLIQSATDI